MSMNPKTNQPISCMRKNINLLMLFPTNEPFEVITTAHQSPWLNKLNPKGNIKKIDYVYPSGLLSIAAYVHRFLPEAQIRILDCNVVMGKIAEGEIGTFAGMTQTAFFNYCAGTVSDFQPDIIAVSTLFCSNYQDLKNFVSFWRKRCPDALIIGGGHLTAAIFQRTFADGIAFDAISGGEGEIPVRELCQAWQNGQAHDYLNKTDCWATPQKVANDPDFSPARKLIENLDDIPPLDFTLLVFPDVYFNSSRYFFVIESLTELKEIFIFSSRGCPYHCVFCASQNVHGHRVRTYSTERLKQDILYYNQHYGITRFVFYDDHFLADKKRAIEILDFVSAQHLRAEIPTPAFFSLDDDVAAAMARAGIREVNITMESGNENTLRTIMHKPGTLAQAKKAVDALHRAGILAVCNILIGLPGETPDSIEAGVRYLQQTDINWFQCFVTAPLPGSTLWTICEQNGYFTTPDPFVMDFKKCVIRTPDFDPEYIEHKVYEMNLRLNFINNYDMRNGNYAGALAIFERILNTVINTHAFAYYFAAICCQKLGQTEKFERYRRNYAEMVERYPFWRSWKESVALPELM